MNTRFLVSVAFSGAVHFGVFVVGAGMYDQYTAGLRDPRVTDTLTVSVGMARSESVAEDPDTPPPETPETRQGGANTPEPELQKESIRENSVLARKSGDIGAPEKAATVTEPTTGPEPAESNRVIKKQTPSSRPVSPPTRVASTRPRSEYGEARRGESRDQVEKTYLSEFLAELSRHKHYPRSARLRHQQGTVVVGLLLKRDGSITDVDLAETSGYSTLNRAALRSVRKMRRFKPFPGSMDRESWHLSVPFKYAIDDR